MNEMMLRTATGATRLQVTLILLVYVFFLLPMVGIMVRDWVVYFKEVRRNKFRFDDKENQ